MSLQELSRRVALDWVEGYLYGFMISTVWTRPLDKYETAVFTGKGDIIEKREYDDEGAAVEGHQQTLLRYQRGEYDHKGKV